MIDAYEHALGEGMRRRAKKMNSANDTIDPTDSAHFIKEKDVYLERIVESYRFMQRAGWLKKTDQEVLHEQIGNLLKFAKFFEKHTPNAELTNIVGQLEFVK